MPTEAEPLVTIILTTLNSERYLARSIESCLKQTHSNLELLVVDGGSTDRTLEIVAGYDDPRIHVIHQPENSGKLPGALNLGMANARGELITWTQDDCWYVVDAIQTMVEYLQTHPDIALVYSDYWLVDCTRRQVLYRQVSTLEHVLDEDVVQQCFLFRRAVYETIGPQDEQYYPVHEIPWRIKIARQFNMAPLHAPLQYYTLHSNSLTGRFGGYTLQRQMVQAIRSEGYLNEREATQRLAAIDVHEGYEAFVRYGNYGLSRRRLLSGFLKNWHLALNHGLWKMIGMSLLPQREAYRKEMFERWLKMTEEEQTVLLKEFRPAPPVISEGMFDA